MPVSERRSERWLERATLWLSAAALFALGWRSMDLLGDSFWSMATGRWILEHRALPASDPFSFTARGPFLVHMPLCQIVLGWVSERFGLLALELFGALLFLCGLLALWLPHARSARARQCVFGVLVLSVFLQADDLCVRGQLFGDVAFAAFLVCAFRLRDGKRVHAAWAVALGAAWINLHPSAFLAIALPIGFAIASRFDPRESRAAARPYLTFAAWAALGLFINPYGPRLLVDMARLFSASSTRQVDLFQAPDFESPWVLLSFAVCGATALYCWRKPSARGGLSEALLLGVWLIAAATARRYLPLALGFCAVVIGRRMTVIEFVPAQRAWRMSANLALAVASAALAFYGLSVDKDPLRDAPVEEARLVEELALPDRVANIYYWGGYLDYAWNGRRKTFVDGRNHLFDHGAFEDEARLQRLDDWSRILREYRVNCVIWERGSALDEALAQSDAWSCVKRGRIGVVYVRRNPI